MPKELCSVKYPDFADTVKLIQGLIKNSGSCMIGKSDASSAFRNLGILPQHWRYLIMKAQSPIDGQWYYFIDKCLPFGASISCSHFQRVLNATAHIVKFKTKQDLINYWDDFLFAAILKYLCDQQMEIFIEICGLIGMPLKSRENSLGMQYYNIPWLVT